MSGIQVRIPCRRFSVRVTLGQTEGLSTFEEFMLRMIAAGAGTVERLAEDLCLPLGVVLDTCVDLLRVGYIFLDHTDSSIQITDAVRDEMGDALAPRPKWASRLAPASTPSSASYDLLQDLVSGAVFPSVKGLVSPGNWILAPEDLSLGDASTIQKPILLAAAARLMKKVTDARGSERSGPLSRRGISVTDVAIVGGGERTTVAPSSIVVEIVRRKSVDEERPNLVLVGPPELSGGVRRRIASRLMSMWDDGCARGKGQFFESLLERLTSAETLDEEPQLSPIIDPSASTALLTEAIQDLDAVDLTRVDLREAHWRLHDLERRASANLDEAQTLQADVNIVVNAAEHHKLLLCALAEANHQVVLTSPWVGQLERNKELQDALIAAVERGVRVHLLWGMDRASEFATEFGPASRELVQLLAPGDQRVGGLFLASRPAGVHAKLIACDMDWAVVSSCNVLNSRATRREFELGLKISPPRNGDRERGGTTTHEASVRAWTPVDSRQIAAAAVCDFIRFARGITPDFELRRTIVDDVALDGRRLLAPPVEIGGEVEEPGDLKIWRATFERRATILTERTHGLQPIAQAVVDGQHREFFIAAVRMSRKRLVVSSRDLGIGLLGEATADLVVAACKRGVEVSVIHAGFSDWTQELERRKTELIDAGVAFHMRDVHAKLLVCDNWAIVSSYNFLSFAGYYDINRRARHELGVRVFGADLVDRLVLLLHSAPTR